jgi:hypothetical protein
MPLLRHERSTRAVDCWHGLRGLYDNQGGEMVSQWRWGWGKRQRPVAYLRPPAASANTRKGMCHPLAQGVLSAGYRPSLSLPPFCNPLQALLDLPCGPRNRPCGHRHAVPLRTLPGGQLRTVSGAVPTAWRLPLWGRRRRDEAVLARARVSGARSWSRGGREDDGSRGLAGQWRGLTADGGPR